MTEEKNHLGLTRTEMEALLTADKTGAGRALLKVIECEYRKEDRALKANPQRNDKDLRSDYVFRLGRLEGLEYILKLIEELNNL